jgi:integrase
MSTIGTINVDRAMIRNGTVETFEGPSVAEAIARLETGKSSLGEEGRALASQLERLARVLQREPHELPGDSRKIRLILGAEIGEGWRTLDDFASPGAWRVFKSRVKTALNGAFNDSRVDPLAERGRAALMPAWQALMASLDEAVAVGSESKWTVFTMTGLARFASSRRVEPENVDGDLFRAWIAEAEGLAKAAGKIVRRGRVRGPGRHAYDAARQWNSLVESGRISGNLIVLTGLKTSRKWNVPISQFHPELRNEIDAYLEWLKGGVREAAFRHAESNPAENPYMAFADADLAYVVIKDKPDNTNGPMHREAAVKAGTIKRYTHMIRWAVNAVAEGRKVPVETIRSLSEVANAIGLAHCLFIHEERQRQRGRWDSRRGTLYNYGAWLLGTARAWCRADDEQIARMQAILKVPRIKTESAGGMSAERRDALKNVHHAWFVKEWVELPEVLVDECRKSGGGFKTDERSRATMRAAVALAIGQILPARLENLGTLTISGRAPTLVRPRVRNGVWSVDIPAHEIKNENGAYGPLDKRVSRIISDYVTHVRPYDLAKYGGGKSDCLFPGSSNSEHRNGHIGLDKIGNAISSRLRDAGLGNLVTHHIRHITATLLLAMYPDRLKTVADLLGDTVETVERCYVFGNTAAAVKMNLSMIEAHLRPSGKTLAGFAEKVKRRAA